MRFKLTGFIVLLFWLTACGASSSSRAFSINQGKDNTSYTYLGKPEVLNGGVYRMDRNGVSCYLMYGGIGISISCPASQKGHAETPTEVTFTDLGQPGGLNGAVAQMQDGQQTCYLIWGGTGVGINCP